MKRRIRTAWAILTSLMIASTGCRPQQPFYLKEDGDLSHYLGVATEIEYPDVEQQLLPDVDQALPPLTLANLNFAEKWKLTLEEAIQSSLANSKVFRSLGGRFVSSAFNNRAQTGDAPDALTSAPDASRTVYDAAITETTPFSGVEYALSQFDTQWSTNLFYQKNDRQQNVRPTLPISAFFVNVFQQDTATFNTQLTKFTAQGGQFTVRNNIVYDLNNNPTRQVAADWNANYEVSFNQPLLAGAGVQFNRIAGPFNPFSQVVGGAQQSQQFDGVLLARINVDISLADFEAGVRNLVNDTEQSYWELAFAWRNLETSQTALESARQTWKKIHLLYIVGTRGGEAKEEAQAREQFYQFKSQTQTLLNELFRAENRLRYVMGIAVTDGRLILPIDKPTVAKVEFDWRETMEEAMSRSLDLRRQKWKIKQQELQVIAAKNLVMPRLDLNGTYRWLGLGDSLLDTGAQRFNPANPVQGLQNTSALGTLASGQFQEWALGMQATMPIGFRKELATVRFYQLSLARERARLQDEELEISHQVADALRQLELNYQLTETNFNRTLAADRQVEAVQAAFEAETVTLDQLLEAQRRRSEAQTSYFRTLLDYQRAIITIHYRKGSLLEYDNVYLNEGPWPAKAQFDAHRLARQRDASVYLNYGFTRPDVSSQGPIRQMKPGEEYLPGGHESSSLDGIPTDAAAPEELPTPAAAPPGSSVELNTPLRVQTAAAVQRGFEWGPLGLASESSDLDKLPDFDSLDGQTATTVAKGASPKKNGPVRSRETSLMQPVMHQEQLPTSSYESLENQPPRPAARAATGRPRP
ncbi:MAG TPA: TolC family protein [Pirellulales bacterium]